MLDPIRRTNPEYYFDGCHLNIKGLGLAIAAFRKAVADNGLQLPDFFARPADELCTQAPSLREIASTCKLTKMSSVYRGARTLIVSHRRGYILHTQADEKPFALIDIGYGAFIERIDIYNRFDGFFERAKTLTVSVGLAEHELREIHRQSEVFGSDGAPIQMPTDYTLPIRYIHIALQEKEHLHLGKIEIFERSFATQ